MRKPDLNYSKLVLVCTNEREEGRECCKKKGSADVFYELKSRLAALDPNIRVSKTGCLGNCLSGAMVVIMPDDIWLGEVTTDDVPEIIKMLNVEETSEFDLDSALDF